MLNKTKNIALVYMVAGLSRRFGGRIKQLVRIGKNDETLIEISLQQALNKNSKYLDRIIFVVGDKTEREFVELFGSSYRGIKVEYAKQDFDINKRDRPWGTTDALCSARELLKDVKSFIVCNGDDIYGENAFETLVSHLRDKDGCACVGYELKKVIPEIGSTNRGIFQIDKKDYVVSIEEILNIEKINLAGNNLTGQELCNMNIFALNNYAIGVLSNTLDEFKTKHFHDRKIECLLPVELSNLIKSGKINMRLYKTNDKWFGVTNPGDEEKIKKSL